jgi:spermidine synthase
MRSLYLLVFTSGFVTLGVELSASRLLEPAFGSSQIVWAALIGMILLYLALGAWLGGRLADRYPRRSVLDGVLTAAAVGVALIPLFSPPVLRMAATGLEGFAPGLLGGALAAILLLFSVPVILLGTSSTWAVRLLIDASPPGDARMGARVGRLYAMSTVGSLLGAFVPVLWLIPAIGTRLTFFAFALTLLVVLAVGALGRRHMWLPLTALLIVSALALWSGGDRSIRAGWDDGSRGPIIFEDESRFNYIAVRQWGSERHLKLNDGIGIHSVYHPDALLSDGIWDYFLLAPLFRTGVGAQPAPESLLVVGAAAGTVSGLYAAIYGPSVAMTGVELDPEILQVGSEFFAMDRPNLTTVAADGRHFLTQQPADARWDVIAVDAYRPPYIPFHLTTVEFFATVRDHLSDNGVLAINVGRTAANYALVDAMAATVRTIFPTVFLIDEPGPVTTLGNTLLVATMQPATLEDFAQSVAALPLSLPDAFRTFAQGALANARVAPPVDLPPFTDDHAPVESIVHRIILDFLIAAE